MTVGSSTDLVLCGPARPPSNKPDDWVTLGEADFPPTIYRHKFAVASLASILHIQIPATTG
jgi:hypothetical protein